MRSVTLFSSVVLHEALNGVILNTFTAETAVTIDGTFAPTSELIERIEVGARPDVMIGVTSQLNALGQMGVLDPRSCRAIAKVAVGIAVDPAIDSPDISTVDALIQTLINARSVAYSLGPSGVYFGNLVRRLGIAEEVTAKGTIVEKGLAAYAVIDGRADLAVQQLSELRSVPGAKIVGPLPEGAQQYTELSAAVAAHAPSRADASALVSFLSGPLANHAYLAAGLELPDPH